MRDCLQATEATRKNETTHQTDITAKKEKKTILSQSHTNGNMEYQNHPAICGSRQKDTHSRTGTVPMLKEMIDWRKRVYVRVSANGV